MARRRPRTQAEPGAASTDWPPEWITSFADASTLLMTFFIILSIMLVLRIDLRALDKGAFQKKGEQPRTGKRVLKKFKEEELQLIDKFKEMEEQNLREEVSVSQVGKMGKNVQQFILNAQLNAFVRVDTSKWKMKVVPLAPFLFAPGQAVIRPAAQDFLDNMARVFQMNPGQIRITGHTDNLPIYTPVYRSNWELSCARASAVMRYLVEKHGIEPERCIALGFGPYQPVAPNDTPENRALNRRVEIEFIQTPPSAGGESPSAGAGTP